MKSACVGGSLVGTIVCGGEGMVLGREGKPTGVLKRVPKPTRQFQVSVDRAHLAHPLWTLGINRVASLLSLSNSILRFAAHRAAVRRGDSPSS